MSKTARTPYKNNGDEVTSAGIHCSTREPRPPKTRGLRLLTGASQARRVCSLMPSEDTVGRRGPPHTGGRWRGTTEQAVKAAVNENCQFASLSCVAMNRP